MHRNSIYPKHCSITNQRVKMCKKKSSKFQCKVHEIIFSLYNVLNLAYVVDNLYEATMKAECPV
jgi:hypothetical protein